jgi:hypothetical protein
LRLTTRLEADKISKQSYEQTEVQIEEQTEEQAEEHLSDGSECKATNLPDLSIFPEQAETTRPLIRRGTTDTSRSGSRLNIICAALNEFFISLTLTTTFHVLRTRHTNDMLTSLEDTLEELTYDAIRERLVPDYDDDEQSCYLPEGDIKALICKDKVGLALEQLTDQSIEPDVLIAFVCNEAPRIFTALVWIAEKHLIEVFWKNRFGDSMLPITERLDKDFLATTDPGEFEALEEERRRKLRGVFGDRKFNQKSRDDFRKAQWLFMSPIFTSDKFLKSPCDECCYRFDRGHRLPFVKEELSPTSSGRCPRKENPLSGKLASSVRSAKNLYIAIIFRARMSR